MPMHRLRPHLWPLLLYTILALLLTWPLVAHFTTHVTGDGIDDPALAWNLWWIKARLVDQRNPDIFHVGWMFHPIDINLAFYTLTPLNGLLSVPLQTALSLVVANNLLLLSSFVLGGYGTFLLVRDLPGHARGPESARSSDHPPPAVRYLSPATFAGLVYAFASSKLFYAGLGQFNIASSQWVPFCVLYVLRTGRGGDTRAATRNALLAGLFLVLQAWAELTYASFLLIFIGICFVWSPAVGDWGSATGYGRSSRPRSRAAALRAQTAHFALIGLVFLVGLAPFLWAMVPDMRREGNFFTSGGGFADIFSADLLGYFVPTRLHPLLGDLTAALPFANDKGQHIFIGYTVMALAVAGSVALVRRRGWRGGFWPVTTLLFWLLTLGPHLRWAGQDTAIPGPFALIDRLPFFSGNRYPSRYSVMVMLAVAVLAGYGLDRASRRLAQANGRAPAAVRQVRAEVLLAGLLALLFLFEHLSLPLPVNDFRVPPIYRRIAAEPGDFAVLELPTGWRNGARVLGRSDVLIMMQQWYQTVHGKRRLGGNTSRNPPYKFQYFTQAPLIGDLIALMNADRPHLAPAVDAEWEAMAARDRAIAPRVLDFLDVKFVVVYVEKAPPQLRRFVEEVLPVTLVEEWQGTDWSGRPGTVRLYRVNGASERAAWAVNLGEPDGRLYLAEGWSTLGAPDGRIRYATRAQVDLLLDIPTVGGNLALELVGPAPRVALRLNGRALTAATTGRRVTVNIPPGMANRPVDRLTLEFQGTLSPSSWAVTAPADGWPIGATGHRLPADRSVVVLSAGEEVGDFAHIHVGGAEVTPSIPDNRGYNLVALDDAGQVLDQAVFDTLAAPDASAAMAAWLRRWPHGTVIAGAVADEASLNLGQDAVEALAGVGVAGDLRGHFRWSHAFVGVVGASPGSAVEDMRLLQPAAVAVGGPVDAPFIGGGVGQVQIVPAPP